MAAEVLTGQLASNNTFTYTNSTGGNVRVVINYIYTGTSSTPTIEFGDASATGQNAYWTNRTFFNLSENTTFGKSLGWSSPQNQATGQNAVTASGSDTGGPTEVYLKNTETFKITASASSSFAWNCRYQIVVIPE
tara:strand:- start:602 stop:1006 length:405 start_codon:yes stop_codon:yes gene_type:complete